MGGVKAFVRFFKLVQVKSYKMGLSTWLQPQFKFVDHLVLIANHGRHGLVGENNHERLICAKGALHLSLRA